MSSTGDGYFMQDGRYASTQRATVLGLVSVTGAASAVTGPAYEMGDHAVARLDLNVSGTSGTTPTLDVTIEQSVDQVTWTTLAAFAQATADGSVRKIFGPTDRFIRTKYTIGGTTPTFTFEVKGFVL